MNKKLVILAGGLGSRLSEETVLKPKPLVEIGGMPMLWHIMKIYSHYGINDFIICLGYKGYLIKEYFANYSLHSSDVTFDLQAGGMTVHNDRSEPWRITLVDTGSSTQTGGRIKRVARYVQDDEYFFMTYGDGVSNVALDKLEEFYCSQGRLAAVTAVRPAGRFGTLNLEKEVVTSFQEKPLGDGGWINGGFFVLSPAVINYIEDDSTVWEDGPLPRLARENQLCAYQHTGFWHPMDTLRDKRHLESMWETGKAPWHLWKKTPDLKIAMGAR